MRTVCIQWWKWVFYLCLFFFKYLGTFDVNKYFIALIHPIQWTIALPVGQTKKDAMMSACLDRKYGAQSIECALHDRSCRYYIQDGFFCRFAGLVALTGKAIVHWMGY